jgi:hypothetical protein
MPTIPPTQYKLTDNIRQAIVSVISAGQNYVPSAAIMFNRSAVSADIPRIEVDVSNVTRASLHLNSIQVSNQVTVSSAGTAGANGVYTESGTHAGRARYIKGGYHIQWDNGQNHWHITTTSPSSVLYNSTTSVTYPWQGTYTVGTGSGAAPAPSVTQATNWFYDHFAADVGIKVVTDRSGATAANHEDVVQSVRYLMSREAQTLISPVVTWYDVLDVVEESEAHEVMEETREDHSTIGFRLELGIIGSSYAVPSVGSAL